MWSVQSVGGDIFPSLLTVVDMEIELLHKLAIEILSHEDLLISVSDVCGQIDWWVPT